MDKKAATYWMNKIVLDLGISDAKAKKVGDKSIKGKEYGICFSDGTCCTNSDEILEYLKTRMKTNPVALEKDLIKRAKKLGLKGDRMNAYVYGTMQKIEKAKQKKNPPYGYGTHENPLLRNPPKEFSDLERAVSTINHSFDVIGKHVSISVEAEGCTLMILDNFTGDISKTFGPLSKDAITYIVTGMLESIKIFKYED